MDGRPPFERVNRIWLLVLGKDATGQDRQTIRPCYVSGGRLSAGIGLGLNEDSCLTRRKRVFS